MKFGMVVGVADDRKQIEQPCGDGGQFVGPVRYSRCQRLQHGSLVMRVGADGSFAANRLDQAVGNVRAGVVVLLVQIVGMFERGAVTLGVNREQERNGVVGTRSGEPRNCRSEGFEIQVANRRCKLGQRH